MGSGDNQGFEAPSAELSDARGPVAVFDTSEMRWFTDGPLPAEVLAWFEADSAVVEQRRDIYQLNGVPGLGIKLRGGDILEVKRLQSVGPDIDLGDGLRAPVTQWQKLRPLDTDSVLSADGASFVTVEKTIVKRSFGPDISSDQATALQASRPVPGCKVEVAAVTIEDTECWTFALEAYGPAGSRSQVMLDAWQTIIAEAPPPEGFASSLEVVSSYPDWIEERLADRLAS